MIPLIRFFFAKHFKDMFASFNLKIEFDVSQSIRGAPYADDDLAGMSSLIQAH